MPLSKCIHLHVYNLSFSYIDNKVQLREFENIFRVREIRNLSAICPY